MRRLRALWPYALYVVGVVLLGVVVLWVPEAPLAFHWLLTVLTLPLSLITVPIAWFVSAMLQLADASTAFELAAYVVAACFNALVVYALLHRRRRRVGQQHR